MHQPTHQLRQKRFGPHHRTPPPKNTRVRRDAPEPTTSQVQQLLRESKSIEERRGELAF